MKTERARLKKRIVLTALEDEITGVCSDGEFSVTVVDEKPGNAEPVVEWWSDPDPINRLPPVYRDTIAEERNWLAAKT